MIARDSDLLTADTPGRLLAWRINAHTADRTAPAPLAPPTLDDTRRYAVLLSGLTGGSDLDPVSATRAPALLGGSGAPRRSSFVSSDDLAAYAEATADALHLPVIEVAAHRSWPHLAASLAAAHRSGRDIPALLGPLAAKVTERRTDTAVTGGQELPDDRMAELSRQVRRLLKADPATGPFIIPSQLKHTVTAAAALGHDTAERLRAVPVLGRAGRRFASSRAHRTRPDRHAQARVAGS